LGVTTQRVKLGQETGLKVVSVIPGSPAEAAGVEPGDVLVAANRTPLENESQLGDLYARADRGFSLTVRDVRSGRDVDVDVETMRGGLGADVPASGRPGVGRPGAMKPLGVTTKLAFLSGSPVLEITAVDAGSPAQRAGLAAGWLIVEANGNAVGSPEELTAQEQASRGRLELKVVDPSDRRERVVRVDL
jgi:serine protease Do